MGVLSPIGGEVLWDGRPITQLDRRQFGYMPEERGLYPKQPVLDQLVYLGRLRGLGAAAARAEVTSHLERLGLADRAKDHVEKLSLGNQQRVQIIAAAHGPAARPRARRAVQRPRPGSRRQHGRPAARAHHARRPGPLLLPPARPRRTPLRAPRRAGPRTRRRVRDPDDLRSSRSRDTGSSSPATPAGSAVSPASMPSTSRGGPPCSRSSSTAPRDVCWRRRSGAARCTSSPRGRPGPDLP